MDNRKIGVFDSGIGGLTVVSALFEMLPKESLVYFGDTRNVPYGNRPKAEITAFSIRIAKFLKGMDVKAILIACNTVSAVALDALRDAVDVPIFDVLTPGAAAAARAATRAVGVIGTRKTVESGAHARIIKAHNPALKVHAIACPLFAPIVEEGLQETDVAIATAKYYLSGLSKNELDLLLLGCTHYPVLQNAIAAATDVPLLNPATAAVQELALQLEAANALSDWLGENEFFTSGDTAAFDTLSNNAFGITTHSKAV